MIALFLIYVSLIIPNVYAQEYDPSSDIYDGLINVLLPLIIISVYTCSDRVKKIVGSLELITLISLIVCFPPIYNFFIYKSTSIYDFVCMISSIFALTFSICLAIVYIIIKRMGSEMKDHIILVCLNFLGCLVSVPAVTFSYIIYWIKKDVIIEKISYEWFIVASSFIFLMVIILLTRGELGLAIYFYGLVSVGLSFSIAYSNNGYFTRLVLAIMSYFLARMFDKEVVIGKFIGKFTTENIMALFKGDKGALNDKSKILRFYIDEAESLDGQDMKFTIGNGFKDEDNQVQVQYDSTAPRVAYYLHNIQDTNVNLNIKVNGFSKNYPLNELKSGILVQTPKLLNRIILTMTLLDDDDDDDDGVIEIDNDEINNDQVD